MPVLPTNLLKSISLRPVVFYGKSGESSRLPLAAAVYRDSTTGLYRLASAATAAKCPAAGLVYVPSKQNFAISICAAGIITQPNWRAVTGTSTLTPGSTYYLSTVIGRLTTSAAQIGSILTQPIALAVAPDTIQVLGNVSNLPNTGLSRSLRFLEDLAGAYWDTVFQHGLLTAAVLRVPTVIVDDGAGGFWKLMVNSAGNVYAETNAGPATADAVLADTSGAFWKIIVSPGGLRGLESHDGPATGIPTLTDELGNEHQLVASPDGQLGSEAL